MKLVTERYCKPATEKGGKAAAQGASFPIKIAAQEVLR